MATARPDRSRRLLPVAVVVEDKSWSRAIPDAATLCRKAARAAYGAVAGRSGPPAAERSIVIALGDDALLHDLNRRYRGKDRPTNVLSFTADEPGHLGDIALALPTLRREAREQDKTLRHHLTHLVVHGVLHLLGYDHERAADARVMERQEVEILEGLGVPDPYRPPQARPKGQKSIEKQYSSRKRRTA